MKWRTFELCSQKNWYDFFCGAKIILPFYWELLSLSFWRKMCYSLVIVVVVVDHSIDLHLNTRRDQAVRDETGSGLMTLISAFWFFHRVVVLNQISNRMKQNTVNHEGEKFSYNLHSKIIVVVVGFLCLFFCSFRPYE